MDGRNGVGRSTNAAPLLAPDSGGKGKRRVAGARKHSKRKDRSGAGAGGAGPVGWNAGTSSGSLAAYAGGLGADFVNESALRRHKFRAFTVARLAFFASNFTVLYSLLVGCTLDAFLEVENGPKYSTLTRNLKHYGDMLLGMAVGAVATGVWMDKGHVRRVAVTVALVSVAGSIASSAAAGQVLSNTPTFGIMRGITGLGVGGMFPLAALLSGAAADPSHRGRELVITFLMQLAGYAVAVVLADLLLQFVCTTGAVNGVMQPCTVPELLLVYRILMGCEALLGIIVAYLSWGLRPPPRTRPATEVVMTKRFSLMALVCSRKRELMSVALPWMCVDAVVYGTSLLGGQELNGLEVFGSSYSVKSFALKNVAMLVLTAPGYFIALRAIESFGRRRLQLLGFGCLSASFALMGVAAVFLPTGDQVWRASEPWLFPLLLTIPTLFANLGPNATTFVTGVETTDQSLRGTIFGIGAGLGKAAGFAGLLCFRELSAPGVVGGAALSFGTAAILGACGGMATLCLTDDLGGEQLEYQGSYMRLLGQQPAASTVSESAAVTSNWTIPFTQLHVGRQIASGAFGRVFFGRYIGSTVAIKELFLNRATAQDVADFKHEHTLLSSLHHPNIVTYFGASMNHPYYYIVTEYVPHCLEPMLFTDPNPPQMEQIEKIARDVVKGVAYLHSRGVVHRDLKPSNVLVDDQGVAKICDFGMARLTKQNVTFAMGTIAYTAPEVIRVTEGLDWQKADVYAFGSTLYEMVHRKKLFAGMTDFQIMDLVVRRQKRPPVDRDVPTFLADVIKMCWLADPAKRPSFARLVTIFRRNAKTSFGADDGNYHTGLSPPSEGGSLPKVNPLLGRHPPSSSDEDDDVEHNAGAGFGGAGQ